MKSYFASFTRLCLFLLLLAGMVFQPQATVYAAASLSFTPLTWNVIGLDSNNVNVGPNNFPVGARVCNTGDTTANNVSSTFNWEGVDPTPTKDYIHLRPGSNTFYSGYTLAPLACVDFYYEVQVTRNSNAYGDTRQYYITATADTLGTITTPRPREIYVERLVSQNRNAVTDVQLNGTSIAPGGTMNLMVGQTYTITLIGFTATQGYEQLESFINFPNTIFQINSVSFGTSAFPSPPTDLNASTKLYENGCKWEDDPNSPNYRSCLGTGKYGGNITVTYTVTILSGAGTTQPLSTLIYDFSGSSYHYNSDFGVSTRYANIVNASLTKSFSPKTILPGGTSTLTFTITNPGTTSISSVNFTDALPSNVALANTTVTYTQCGTSPSPSTLTVNGPPQSLSFSSITVAGGSTCTIAISVTSSTNGTYNNITSTLKIDTTDTGSSGSDTLIVSSQPAPPSSCTTSTTLATWNFNSLATGTNNGPFIGTLPVGDASGATATYGVGTGSSSGIANSTSNTFAGDPSGFVNPVAQTPDSNSWGIHGGWPVSGVPTGTTTPYFQFQINASNYGGLTFTASANLGGSWSNGDNWYVLTSTDGTTWTQRGTGPWATSTFKNNWGTVSNNTSTPANAGTTYFRVYFVGAQSGKTDPTVFLDNVSISGCARPIVPTLSKSFSPASITTGSTSTLTFTFTNPNSGTALTGVGFTDVLPSGLLIATPNGLAQSCTTGTFTGATITATAGTSTINVSSGTLSANADCKISVNILGDVAGAYTNVTSSISSTETGPNLTSGGIGTSSLTVVDPPVIAKSFTANPIFTGNTTTLTFTINNPNIATTLTGVNFVDALPSGLALVPPGTIVTDCVGAVTLNFVLSTVSLSLGTLTPNTSCTISVEVQGTTPGVQANSVTVRSTNGGDGNTATASVLVKDATPLINLLKQVGPSASGPWGPFLTTPVGDPVYYSFYIENTGDVSLNPVTVTDIDPAVDALLAGCTWYHATYGPGPTYTYLGDTAITPPLQLPAAAPGVDPSAYCIVGPITAVSGSHTNTATASGTSGSTTKSSSATYGTPALMLVKSVSPTSFISAGDTLNYSYLVTNTGYAPLLGPVTITDDKITSPNTVICPAVSTVGDGDDWLEPADYPSGSGSPAESLTCTASYTVVANPDVSPNGYVTNIASATVSSVTSNTASQTVDRAADLTITKTNNVSGATGVGNTFTWTLTVSNSGNSDATFTSGQTILSDPLPAGPTYGSPAAGSFVNITNSGNISCSITAGILSCIASGADVTVGALTGSFAVSFTVTPASAGNLSNTATVDPDNHIPEIDDTNNNGSDIVTVIAPPSISKSFGAATIPLNGTSVITFTITNPAANTVALTGVTFTDTYPSGMQNAAVPNASTNCTNGIATTPTTTSVSLSGATIAVNSSCTVTVTVTATTAGTKSNSVQVFSTNGGMGNTAIANLGVISATKSVVGTSEDSTTGNNVVIGEIVRYRIIIDLPEGITTNLQFVDSIVTNMAYLNDNSTKVAFVCNNGASCASSSTAAIGTNPVISGNSSNVTPTFVLPASSITGGAGNPYGDGVDPTFSLGNVTNNDSDADAEYVVIEFNSIVRNVAANQQGSTRGNTFTVNVNGTALTTTTSVVNDQVTIREPAITGFTKSITTPPTDAGDRITYQLQITNSGNAPAFDIIITDTLNVVQTMLITVGGSTTGGSCGSTASTVIGSGIAPTATARVTCLNPGGIATIVISADLSNMALAGYTFTNSASLVYTSLPGTNGTPNGSGGNSTGSSTPGTAGSGNGERIGTTGTNDYTAASNTVSTTLANPSLAKTINPAGTTYAIGATIPYEITITVPEGVTGNPIANLVDTIPTGLTYVPGSLSVTPQAGVTIGAAGPYTDGNASFFNLTGQTLTLTFGSFTSTASAAPTNRTIVVAFNVTVNNDVGNQSGTTFTNSVDFIRTNPNGAGTITLNATAPAVSVVEPVLIVNKVPSTTTPAYNSTLTYTLTVSHTSASNSPAYDTVVTDTLPSGLTNLTNVNVTSSAPANCATGVVNNSTANTLSITIGTIPLGCAVTITYDVTVSGALGSTQTNSVNATWTSQPGSVSGERTGSDGVGGALNDYAATTSQTVTVTGPDLGLAKTNGVTSITAGGTTTYSLTVTNSGNSASSGTITVMDVLPTGLSIPDGAVTVGGTNAADWTCTALSNVITCTSGAAIAVSGISVFSFTVNIDASASGTVVNKAQVGGGGDPTNPNVPTSTTTGQCTGTNAPNEGCSTDSDTVNTPSFTITKDADVFSVDAAGDIITYTVILANTGNVPLTGVNVIDPLLADLDCDGVAGAPFTTTGLTIAVNGTLTCTGTYTVTQNDIDTNGGGDSLINNTVTGDTNETGPQTASEIVEIIQTFSIVLTKTPTLDDTVVAPSGVVNAGDTITYAFSIQNTGNTTITGVTVTDPLLPTLSCTITSLSPGTTTSCFATNNVYTLTQADIDAGSRLNTATATGLDPGGNPVTDTDTKTVTLPQLPSIVLTKTPTLDDTVVAPSGVVNVGDTITYTFSVQNTGNVTITNIVLTDPLLPSLSCTIASLAPGATSSCSATNNVYTLTQADINAGSRANTATATGKDPNNNDVPDADTKTTTLPQVASILLTKTANPTSVTGAGDVITYTFSVQNTGNVTLTNVTISDTLLSGLNCTTIVSLSAGATQAVTCTGNTYTVTQTDIDMNGGGDGDIDNTATATGTPPSGGSVSDTDSQAVILPAQSAGISLTKTGTLNDNDGTPGISAGDTITYVFVVTNTGNITLTNITVVDTIGGVTISGGPIPSLAPGASDNTTFTGTYTITTGDIAAGTFTNTATVTGTPPSGPNVTASDNDIQSLASNPSIVLTKTANPTSVAAAGDIITYTFSVQNTGNVTLTNITIADTLLSGLNCTTIASLAPGASQSFTCTGNNYTVTQTDIDDNGGGDGDIDNTATVTGTTPGGGSVNANDSQAVTLPAPNPALTLTKMPTLDDTVVPPRGVTNAGDTITYTFSVQNTGNVTITSIVVTDPLLSTLSCMIASLAPGATASCTATNNVYTLTQADINAGSVSNTATATGTPPSGPNVTDPDTQTTTLTKSPSLNIVKEVGTTASGPWNDTSIAVTIGDTVFYRIRVANTGNITLTGLIVDDGMAGCTLTRGPDITGNNDNAFEVGEEWAYTCSLTAVSGTHNNTATADTVETPQGSDDASYTASAALVADPALAKAGNPSRASVGDTLTFTLTVTNAGNAPAPNVVITDTLPAMFDVTGVTVNAAPIGTSVNVTPPIGMGPAPYTVTVTLGGNLNVTDIVTINIVTTVNSLGNPPINNTASLTTSALTNITSNDSDTVTIVLRSSSGSNRPALLPATGFAPNVETKLPTQSQDMLYAATDVLLEIPSLGVKIPIVGVPKKNGTWDVSWLSKQAGWLEGSAFPSWNGNSVLTSHVYASNGLPGPFVNLNKLKYGDQIIVHAYGQKYILEVQTNQVVAPNDTSAFKHEEKSWLTLITCKEYDEKTNSYRKRVVVRAVLVKVLWDK